MPVPKKPATSRAAKPASKFNVADRKALDASLAKWKAELRAAHNQVGRLRRLLSLAQARVHHARALVLRRQKQLRALDEKGDHAARTVRAALKYVGTVETPANSNRGIRVDRWAGNFGCKAIPWCGAFAGSMVKNYGKVSQISPRIVYTPYIHQDAEAGVNGLKEVVWSRSHGFSAKGAKKGDLVLFDFGSGTIHHVGILREDWNGTGSILSVEGNTSFDDGGSQSNGGCVALKTRSEVLVYSIVRPAYS